MSGRTEVMIPVPDVRIGAVIGKGGEIITQLKTLVGVKIRISDRDNFVPGTRDRKARHCFHGIQEAADGPRASFTGVQPTN